MGVGSSSPGETTCCGGGAEPIKVMICGVAGQIAYALVPMIASGEMFGPKRPVIIQGLDLDIASTKENMRAVEMELTDGNFPLVVKATFSTNEATAFDGADYAILLGAYPRRDRLDRDVMDKNICIFRTMGRALDQYASKKCKVIVTGSPQNTNALICSHFAPSLPKENFTALTRLDQNRATGQIAQRAKKNANDVKNIVIWGRTQSVPDVKHATIQRKPIHKVLSTRDKQWLKDEFPKVVQQRADEIMKARKASSAMSAARAITDHIHDLHCGTPKGVVVSMGVWSDNNPFGIPQQMFFSMPVICSKGRWSIGKKIDMSEETKAAVPAIQAALVGERELAMEIIAKGEKTTPRPGCSN
eukprot:TRINITY_DN17120_c0_g1_i1.p1 TRINITY_DN17120_c0_g1~~TRINITY_DN17120_c0_g1_i1.p1  ORF type:complete len:359 (-),score=70.59 TRINITY_DN17120_c0_g1_i1:120-1196(-)